MTREALSRRFPRAAFGGLLLAPLLALGACSAVPAGPPGGAVPAWEELAGSHNARVGRVEQARARGVVEIRFRDEDGAHFEQGDVDLWLAPPRRTALYVSKFGERFFWLGSDDEKAWLFDFRGEGITLYLSSDAWLTRVGDEAPLPLHPAELLALSGLRPLPAGGGRVAYDADRDAWALTAPGDPACRLYLDRGTGLPVAAELLDAAGAVVLRSTLALRRYEHLDGVPAPPGAAPRLPTLVSIERPDGSFSLLLSVRAPTADDVRQRYFDLDWLRQRFPPSRVERPGPVAAGIR